MYEYKKIDEARHFLSEMIKHKMDQKLFEFNLSACLSASRSVMQYALEEVQSNGNQKWYDSYITKSTYVKYFKDKRDINIHKKPLNTKKRHELSISTTFSVSVEYTVMDKNGNIISQSPELNQIDANSINPQNISYDFNYTFDDWNGHENVIELIEKYLNEIELFINNGVNLKFIAG